MLAKKKAESEMWKAEKVFFCLPAQQRQSKMCGRVAALSEV